MTDIRDLGVSQQRRFADKQDNIPVIKARTISVDTTSSCKSATRSGYFWVLEWGQQKQPYRAFNPGTVQDRVGLPVLLQRVPFPNGRYQIIGVDWDTIINISDYAGESFLANHSSDHEWPDYYPGADAITIYPRALSYLRTEFVSALSVRVSNYTYEYNGVVYTYDGETLDLSSYVPSAFEAVGVLVYLDPETNTIQTMAGEPVYYTEQPLAPDPLPSNAILSALIRIQGSQTSIVETDITDYRYSLNRTASGASDYLRQLALVEAEHDYALSVLALKV